MASRRSDSSRTTRTPASTSSTASAAPPAAASGHGTSSAPTRASSPTPSHAAGSGLTQTPAKSPVKTPAKSSAAPRRTRKGNSGSSSQSVGVPDALRRAMIAKAAYFHAEQRGFAPGAEVDDWLAAEAEVDVLLKASSGVPQ